MCRLLGYVASHAAQTSVALNGTAAGFRELSTHHCDGWGAVWWNAGLLRQVHSTRPAHTCPEFDELLSTTSDAAILHVRKASPGIAQTIENQHPFIADGMAFAHNGWLFPTETLDRLVNECGAPSSRGTTDSERYFALVRNELVTTGAGNPVTAIARTISRLHAAGVWYLSLNILLLTDRALYSVCCFDPGYQPHTGYPADMFTLRYAEHRDGIIVRSSGWEEPSLDWRDIPNGSILEVDRRTTAVTLHDTRLRRDAPVSGRPKMPGVLKVPGAGRS